MDLIAGNRAEPQHRNNKDQTTSLYRFWSATRQLNTRNRSAACVWHCGVAKATLWRSKSFIENPKLIRSQKYMKTPRWFSRDHLYSQLRMASAVTVISAAAAMAFVAVAPSGPFLLGKPDNTDQAIDKSKRGRDQIGGNRRALPGPETDRGPVAAAEEQYAHRAYPASDVPFYLTVNAHKAWTN